jgi:hypothetical protein
MVRRLPMALQMMFWAIIMGLIYTLFIAQDGYFGNLLIEGAKEYFGTMFENIFSSFLQKIKDIITEIF